jgi:hypothetical protein
VSSHRLPSVDDLAALVQARAEQPAARLRAAIEFGDQLGGVCDALIERFVTEARAAGLSWTEIGRQFTTGSQAAEKRRGTVPPDMDEWPGRWAPGARNALARAVADARELGFAYVGTEHLLLGLLASDDGLAARVLADLGVTRDAVLATSCMNPDPLREPQPRHCLMLMPRLKQALERAEHLADELGHPAAGTEHLLAAILSVPGALAVEILRRVGVNADAIRVELAARLDIDAQRLAAPRRRRWRQLAKVG